MSELFARITYLVFLCLLYYIGTILTLLVSSLSNVSIEFKYLLPIFSLVFLDYCIRIFTPMMFSFDLIDRNYTSSELTLNFEISFHGKYVVRFAFTSISGIPDSNVKMIWFDPAKREETTITVPETFILDIGPNNPVQHFKVVYEFRGPPKPRFKIAFLLGELHVFRPRVAFDLGGKPNPNSYWLIWKTRRN